jgi:hypothetical protein
MLDCVAGFPRARLIVPAPTAITTVAVSSKKSNHVGATAGTAITPVTITNTGSGIYSYSISPAISNGLSFNKKTGTIVMIGLSTTLKAFNETEKMAIARSLVSLFRVFVVFFIFKNND